VPKIVEKLSENGEREGERYLALIEVTFIRFPRYFARSRARTEATGKLRSRLEAIFIDERAPSRPFAFCRFRKKIRRHANLCM